ncbi:putative alpha-galactosidase [Actinoplanes missouriensis 431]|uniref:Alpha-galactosidase n=1 Tax=Actinoplanes missouriensis (strain ATCC 14538 / DSM 43046 / CBS 188.64 / JCM 3121 / NBRC 102363 / NCIMB 12654 / NRRL B-3342 / UNCC 431) TaxID=512565 RepID=I0H4S9_ACTM4|nr:ricin-type beta-trefoil lectin domain protein [Actinoplanes missouriensis]BAL88016.1 putative alpha-galactosidase [Actinoplanes missouriensis 431]
MTRTVAVIAALGAAALALTAPAPAAAAPGSPAVRPPLGWNSWNTFGCDISEAKIRAAADAMVSSGMKAAGYQYVVVDDCWQATTRDAAGNLRSDPVRFPSGMKALGDYIHGKGLKFGIYQAPREETCAQYFNALGGATGALGHERQDATTFASWGVDFLKYDWCSPWGTLNDQIAGFTTMRDALRATGRPIVYSINSNSAHTNTGPSYDWGPIADMWRTTEDITDTWTSGCRADCFMGVTEILDVQAPLYPRAGPQHWNDPDMLEVGVRGTFTPTENRAHFSMWAIMAAPLIAGNDITTMSADVRSVLTNPDVLAINQDSAGRQAQRVRDSGETEVWAKTLSDGSAAVALLNRSNSAATVSTTAAEAGLGAASGYQLFDVWTKAARNTSSAISATVPPHGVVMYRVRTGSTEPTPTFSLRGAGSGRCLDVLGGAPADGAQAVVWDCNGGITQIITSASGQLRIGGRCLDAEQNGVTDGTRVILWTCGSGANQQWTLQSDGTVRGARSGKCLDVNAAATANNSPIILWTCTAAANQRWSRL